MGPEVKCQNGLTQLTRGDGVSGLPPSPPWIRLDYGQPPTLTLATNIWGDSKRGTLEAITHHPDNLGSHTCPSAVTRPLGSSGQGWQTPNPRQGRPCRHPPCRRSQAALFPERLACLSSRPKRPEAAPSKPEPRLCLQAWCLQPAYSRDKK